MIFLAHDRKRATVRMLPDLLKFLVERDYIFVVVSPDVLNRFKSEDANILMELERSHTGRLIFRSDPNLHRERYSVLDAETEKHLVDK